MENKYWTILTLYVNNNEKIFYLQNFAWNENDIIKKFKLDEHEIEIFKKTYFNGFEKDINDNELKLLFEYCITNMTVLGVYDIRNNYNRDQKTINSIKENERKLWLNKGYTEINHCEPPIFDYDRKRSVINKRDYLYLLNEKISNYEKELEETQNRYEEDIKELEKEHKEKINNIENLNKLKIQNLEKELEETQDIINENRDKIKKQNWYIEETKNVESNYKIQKEKFDKLVERYKNGEKYIEEQKDRLPIELKQLINKKEIIEDEISKLNDNINSLESKINEKQHLIEKLNNETNIYINNINLNNEKLCNQIKNILNSITNDNISFEEAKKKFYNTVRMYVFNDKKIPDFEKEYAKKIGLNEETIDSIIKSLYETNM